MPGSVVFTTKKEVLPGVTRYDFAWTSDASGAVSGHPQSIYGFLRQVKFIPDADDSPSLGYDVSLVDSEGVALTTVDDANLGDDLSNTDLRLVTFDPPLVLDPEFSIDVVVANAGISTAGIVRLWVTS